MLSADKVSSLLYCEDILGYTCKSSSIVAEDGAPAKSLASSLVVPPVPSALPRPSRPHIMLQTARRSWAFPCGFGGQTTLSPTFPTPNQLSGNGHHAGIHTDFDIPSFHDEDIFFAQVTMVHLKFVMNIF